MCSLVSLPKEHPKKDAVSVANVDLGVTSAIFVPPVLANIALCRGLFPSLSLTSGY